VELLPLTREEALLAAEYAAHYDWGRGRVWHRNPEDYSGYHIKYPHLQHLVRTSASYSAKQAVLKMKKYPELCCHRIASPHLAVAMHRGVFTEEAFLKARQDVIDVLSGDAHPYLQHQWGSDLNQKWLYVYEDLLGRTPGYIHAVLMAYAERIRTIWE
jgi:hypothetical protein